MRPARIRLCLVLSGLLASIGSADEQGDRPPFPERIVITHQETEEDEPVEFALQRNGIGLCEWGLLRIDLYRAALYLEKPTNCDREVVNSNQAKHIRLHFVRGLTRKQMRRAYAAAFRANVGDEADRYEKRIEQFIRLIPQVKNGDLLAFTCVPGHGLEIQHVDKRLGRIPGDDFAALFIRLYVGPKPPTEDLKRGLLGLAEDD
jgi:hypothetical protein